VFRDPPTSGEDKRERPLNSTPRSDSTTVGAKRLFLSLSRPSCPSSFTPAYAFRLCTSVWMKGILIMPVSSRHQILCSSLAESPNSPHANTTLPNTMENDNDILILAKFWGNQATHFVSFVPVVSQWRQWLPSFAMASNIIRDNPSDSRSGGDWIQVPNCFRGILEEMTQNLDW